MSTDRSSESRQGHEQPGANSDTVEYESRQKSGHPGSERDTDRRHVFWDRPSRKTRSTKNTKFSESEHLLVYYIRFCKGHKDFTCY